MSINFFRVGKYIEEFTFIRSFDHVVFQGHINCFSCFITPTTRPMATKLGKMVTNYKKFNPLSHTTLCAHGQMRSRDKLKKIISTKRIPMASKRGRMVK